MIQPLHASCVRTASLALVAALLGTTAAAQTITVTTVEDVTDFAAPKTVSQLPGPDGRVSFREAVTAANNTAGPQTIAFAIPKTDWWIFTQQAMLKQEQGIFSLDDDGTTVDFSTQTAFTGDTNPAGHEVGIYGLEPNSLGVASIYVLGDHCTIRGLDRVLQRGYAIEVWGGHNRIVGCTISGPLFAAVYLTGPFGGAPAVGNVVGGTLPGEGNVLSAGNDGVRIDAPADGNVVVGNVLTGSVHGVAVRGSEFTTTANGNRIGGPTPAERNVIAGAGHYGEEGFPVGAQVSIEWATGTIVEGNFIGTEDGLTSAHQIGPTGVDVRAHASGTIIRGNVISGLLVEGVNHFDGELFGTAIALHGGSSDALIQDNFIGTDASGSAPLPNLAGVRDVSLSGSAPLTGNRVGGTAPGESNTIAFNQEQGVRLTTSMASVRLSGNSIHSNGLLGIDLGALGPTANDANDADAGPNGLQNAPVLLTAIGVGPGTNVTGQLSSVPSQAFSIEFFASASADPTGFGEGQDFLGALEVQTNAAGEALFSTTLSADPDAGPVLTATATQLATGNTSEFSAALAFGAWTDLGFALAGSRGVPLLQGSGALTAGSPTLLNVSGAQPSSPATLVFGLAAINAPFHGGTFVPQPMVLIPLATNAAGATSLNFAWPAALPSGIALYFQGWFADGGSGSGYAATNALKAVTP